MHSRTTYILADQNKTKIPLIEIRCGSMNQLPLFMQPYFYCPAPPFYFERDVSCRDLLCRKNAKWRPFWKPITICKWCAIQHFIHVQQKNPRCVLCPSACHETISSTYLFLSFPDVTSTTNQGSNNKPASSSLSYPVWHSWKSFWAVLLCHTSYEGSSRNDVIFGLVSTK